LMIVLVVCLSLICSEEAPNWRPVVLMHGLLAGAEAMSHAEGWIKADFPGIYVNNVEIGDGRDDSLWMDLNTQVEVFANVVKSDAKLQKGFNLICHSQGGLLCRAWIERHNNPPAYNYISWAGPHDGVYGVPDVNALCPDYLCPWLDDIMDLLVEGAWTDPFMQQHISFAAYWKDPYEYDEYLEYSLFLADINNERTTKNATYKANIISLNRMSLIYSTTDNIVIPKESPWFEFFAIDSDYIIEQWNQTHQYIDDWLGLQTLYKAGKLLHYSVPCGHQDIPRSSCKQYYDMYSRPLLNNTL